MATARSTQAHEKRVKKIAEDAASAIAAESPFEEEVVVVVEESPLGAAAPTRSRGTQIASDGAASMAGMLAQTQQFMADSISRWIDVTSTAWQWFADLPGLVGRTVRPPPIDRRELPFRRGAAGVAERSSRCGSQT